MDSLRENFENRNLKPSDLFGTALAGTEKNQNLYRHMMNPNTSAVSTQQLKHNEDRIKYFRERMYNHDTTVPSNETIPKPVSKDAYPSITSGQVKDTHKATTDNRVANFMHNRTAQFKLGDDDDI